MLLLGPLSLRRGPAALSGNGEPARRWGTSGRGSLVGRGRCVATAQVAGRGGMRTLTRRRERVRALQAWPPVRGRFFQKGPQLAPSLREKCVVSVLVFAIQLKQLELKQFKAMKQLRTLSSVKASTVFSL